MALHDIIITKITIQYEGNGLKEFEEALKANKNEKIKNLNSYLEYNGAKINIKEQKILLEELGNIAVSGKINKEYFAKFPYSFFKPLMKEYSGTVFIFDAEYNALSLGQNVFGRYFCVYENGECVFNAGSCVYGLDWTEDNWYEYIDEEEKSDWDSMGIDINEDGEPDFSTISWMDFLDAHPKAWDNFTEEYLDLFYGEQPYQVYQKLKKEGKLPKLIADEKTMFDSDEFSDGGW